MKLLRWILAGIAAGVIMNASGFLFNMVIFVSPYEDPTYSAVWKQMENWMLWTNLLVLGSGLAFALFYALLYKGIPGRIPAVKGILFGFFCWLFIILPHHLMSAIFINIPQLSVVAWIVDSFVYSLLMGLVVGLIFWYSLES